jgi:DNA polymerase V
MFILADANKFYASCEKVFRPDLKGKPLIVLSNNDGCCIAMSRKLSSWELKWGCPGSSLRKCSSLNKYMFF